MTLRSLFLILALGAAGVQARTVGLEILGVMPGFQDRGGISFQGSVFSSMRNMDGALENGIYLKLPLSERTRDYARTGFGYHVGYLLIPRFPLFRPGLEVGLATLEWVDREGSSEWRIFPHYGVKFQISALSMTVSNLGLGFGLNLPL